jgi:hypothetical protein
MREMLTRSARRLHDAAPHEAGAGFVSDETTLDFLKGMTVRQMLDLLRGPDMPRDNDDRGAQPDIALCSEDIEGVIRVWRDAAFIASYDVDRGRFEYVE